MPKKSTLPPRLRARRRHKTSKTFYYYDARSNGKGEIPLGSDYALALKKWAELEIDAQPRHQDIITFRYAAERYLREVVPTKAPATQHDNLRELKQLYKFFDNPPAPLEQIKPIHIRQYLDWRESKTRANREKALFSHIWNKAREWGYTDLTNPCQGIKGHTETGRKEVYIENNIYDAVYHHASQPLRDAMDMAYLTGQRPGDILKMSETDINDGMLQIKQAKTGKKLRISIEGELDTLITRILQRKQQYPVRSLYLIIDDTGQPFSSSMLRSHFDRARAAAGIAKSQFQFRDIRAKAGTDTAESTGDIYRAQQQLGHANVAMTHQYIRNRRGDKIKPTQK